MLAARDLEPTAQALREALSLGEPFSDPGVAHFGLRNAVFALGDTFLEVVSPIREQTAAGRLIERRGDCGYMLMFQVADLAAARVRAAAAGIRSVFEVELDDIAEVHLHPSDIQGAIVAMSEPSPPASWRWGGPGWDERSVPGSLAGVSVAVGEPEVVAERWRTVIGRLPGVSFIGDASSRGPVEISVSGPHPRSPVEIAGVRFVRA